MTTNILILTNELRHVCGVSNHIKNLVNGFNKDSGDYNFIILCGSKEEGLDSLYRCKIVVNSDLLHSRRNFLTFIRSVFFVRNIIKQNNIKLIHSHNHYAANIARYAGINKNVKTIQTNHGMLSESGRFKHFNADFYVVLSDRIKNHLLSIGIDTTRIKVIKQGISEEFALNPKPHNQKLTVLSASRFTEGKLMDVYIKAANMVHKELHGMCDFYISGEGELENELKSLNEAEGGTVTFIDPKSGYRDILKKAHIFVFNSIKEGTPIVLLEALFSGCKVITSSFIGYDEYLKNTNINYIYEPNNIDELKYKLKNAIINYSENNDSDHVIGDLKLEFSLINMINKHMKLYSEILKNE